jgi:hypothetical protein
MEWRTRGARPVGPVLDAAAAVPVNTLRAIAETTSSARELSDEVVALYPDRINPDVVWISAQAVKPSQSGQ